MNNFFELNRWKYDIKIKKIFETNVNWEATTECRATLDHQLYMCQNLLKNEAEHNKHYWDSIRCK